MKIREIINKQQNLWVALPRETKKHYFRHVNVKDLSDNQKFWKTIKPYFSNKGLNSNKMLLKEKGELISNETELASSMKKFSSILQKSLYLKEDQGGPSIIFDDVLKKIIFHLCTDKIRKT